MWSMIVLGLAPIVVFAVIDYYTSLDKAILSAIASSVILSVISYYFFSDMIFEILLLIVATTALGIWSMKKQDEIYFKFQPVVMNIGLLLFIGWFQYFDTPILLKMLPNLVEVIPPEQFEILQTPKALDMLSRLTEYCLFWIVIHTLVMTQAALHYSKTIWIFLKAIGGIAVAALSLVTMFLFDSF